MKVEYYVKHRRSRKIVATCETSEQAQKQMDTLPKASEFVVCYSPAAIELYIERGERRFANG